MKQNSVSQVVINLVSIDNKYIETSWRRKLKIKSCRNTL